MSMMASIQMGDWHSSWGSLGQDTTSYTSGINFTLWQIKKTSTTTIRVRAKLISSCWMLVDDSSLRLPFSKVKVLLGQKSRFSC